MMQRSSIPLPPIMMLSIEMKYDLVKNNILVHNVVSYYDMIRLLWKCMRNSQILENTWNKFDNDLNKC